MSRLCRRIDSILVQELLNYSSYDSADMLFGIMGFGQPPDAAVPMSDPALIGRAFHAPLMMVADGLGASVEDFAYEREVVIAEEDFEVRAGRIRAGTVSAQRYSFAAVIDGRRAVTIEHITRMRDTEAPLWPAGRGWRVTIDGSPSMVLDATIAVHGEDENDQGCLGTAMHAVHAIGPVCAARPGVRTFLDLPMIAGRHALRRPPTG